MFSKINLIFILFLYSFQAFSQEKNLTLTQKMKQEVSQKIASLKENEPSDWLAALEELSTMASNYINERTKECEGEFAVVEFDEEGKPNTSTRVLSKSEKRLCLLDLLRFRKIYIEEIYGMRKKVAKKEFERRVKRLDEQKNVLIDEINKISAEIK